MRVKDAIQTGVLRASKMLKTVKSARIEDQEVIADDEGKVVTCRARMKATFILG